MSKPTDISPQKDAVNLYLNEMLEECSHSDSQIESIEAIQKAIISAQQNSKSTSENWKEAPFDALIFNVQGLKVAIPLHELDAVHRYPKTKLPRLPGKPAHYLGILSHQKYRSQIIDTTKIILPDGFQHDNLPPHYIVLFDNYRWGLTCNAIDKVVTLNPEHISWRKNTGKRPWLAGTILSQMCSILNVENLSKLLA